ncbi:hypothetical protein PQR65_01000 [Paraburkholderia nemoris]|uniref:ABC-three component system protein n=1 Tax=Paraburkholderia nemoris TaxID=2793076 RepID=UPI0038BD0E20
MNSYEKTIARLMFKSLAARVNGMAFQNVFTQIMSYASPDFAPVKPQGSEGDWKNDGHEPASGKYYQVYAPEVFDEGGAVKKIAEDFSGLVAKWGDGKVYPIGVKEFYFVINDVYRITPGVYPTTYSTLQSLKTTHSLTVCKPFLTKDLEDKLLALQDDQVMVVVGPFPNPADIKVLRVDLVSEVVGHIIHNPVARSLKQSLIDPDFEAKIAFNNLTLTATWLREADYRRSVVDLYFKQNSSFSRQDVRDKLKAIYEDGKNKGFTNDPAGATAEDELFFYILREITPEPEDATDKRAFKDLQDAALVVMAYFFEACDIFEEPPKC